ncbi:hypothetical protein TSUD_147690, partial [Trifolium subterraneum]
MKRAISVGSLEGRVVIELENASLLTPSSFPIKNVSFEEDSPIGHEYENFSQDGWVFLFSLLGIIPLAERLGYTTEQLAFFTGPADAGVDFGLLLMAVMGLLFPAVLHATQTELEYGKSQLSLSRFTSCIMLVAYASYIVFQVKNLKNLQVPDDEDKSFNEDTSNDEEAPEISMWESMIWISILTGGISILSEYLVNTIEGASKEFEMPKSFLSVILLPVIGNAAEHVGAVMFAVKDKLDISLGVAVGSSIQISMFV